MRKVQDWHVTEVRNGGIYGHETKFKFCDEDCEDDEDEEYIGSQEELGDLIKRGDELSVRVG